jgi:CRP/FNR family transcriptional regulator, cyclic AMP receptor protein
MAIAGGSEVISIIDADPDLGELLDPTERERARRGTVTRVLRLPPGKWLAIEARDEVAYHQGFLVIDGMLSREVDVLGRRCVELIGDADVLRPWGWDPSGSHVSAEVEWVVLEPTRMAVLDHALVSQINPWPQLGLELFARGTRRAHWLAIALAISHHPRVDDRLLLTLWQVAERWGKVRPDGISIPLPLPHERLAALIGAHRPAVTTAMGELTRAGLVSRGADRMWVLHGDPPDEVRGRGLAAVDM